MIIYNENGKLVDIASIEASEQYLASVYILENDVVLELGARYGSVSCVINSKLTCKTNQVVVEPDSRVWSTLEKNKLLNNCEFQIIKGFLSNKKLDLINLESWDGYAATSVENPDTIIPCYSMKEIDHMYNLKFNVLIADCEGFLEMFFDENPTFYDNLRLIIFEADYTDKCNYDNIKQTLKIKGFEEILEGHQNVYKRT